MKNMLNAWSEEDRTIYLPALFDYMGFQLVKSESTFMLYKHSKRHYVVLYCEEGYMYYNVRRPQIKMRASDLIREHVSRVEGKHNESIWDKVSSYYEDISNTESLKEPTGGHHPLEKVSIDFNHFHSYVHSKLSESGEFYKGVAQSDKFGKRTGSLLEGDPVFPLYNLQNEVCGYFVDSNNTVTPFGESAISNSIWYSQIPETIDWLIIFNDPKEAIAFDKKFRLKNVVYLALGEINYNTTKILFEIHRLTKVKKMVLTFTGSKKIEGYLRDLHFISFINDSNFLLTVNEKDISVRFSIADEKSFLRFFNGTKKFNQGLTKSFVKYNKVPNQNLINQYSIVVSKDGNGIKVRVPLEVNAIKFFVWCYYKNYLSKTLDILKPKYSNWYLEWEATQSIQIKGKEEQLEEYRIAL